MSNVRNSKKSGDVFVDVEPYACWALVLTRTVYVNGQNNECLPGSLDFFRLFGLHKMPLQSTSRHFCKGVKSFGKRFVKPGKQRYQDSHCDCTSGWWMYVLRAYHHTTRRIKCQRSFTVFISRYVKVQTTSISPYNQAWSGYSSSLLLNNNSYLTWHDSPKRVNANWRFNKSGRSLLTLSTNSMNIERLSQN